MFQTGFALLAHARRCGHNLLRKHVAVRGHACRACTRPDHHQLHKGLAKATGCARGSPVGCGAPMQVEHYLLGWTFGHMPGNPFFVPLCKQPASAYLLVQVKRPPPARSSFERMSRERPISRRASNVSNTSSNSVASGFTRGSGESGRSASSAGNKHLSSCHHLAFVAWAEIVALGPVKLCTQRSFFLLVATLRLPLLSVGRDQMAVGPGRAAHR